MANRFWVGGSGTWDLTDTTHWSTTSGGAGGASVPTSLDAVLIDTSSGGGTVTLGESVSCSTLTHTAFTLNLSSYTLTAALYSSTGSTARALDLGTGTLKLTLGGINTSGAIFSINNVNYTFSGADGSLIIDVPIISGSLGRNLIVFSASIDLNCRVIFTSRNAVRMTLGTTFSNTLEFQSPGLRLELETDITFGSDCIFINHVIDGLWNIVCTSPPATQRSIIQTSGNRTLENLALQDINFTGGASFIGENCIDLGNVSGIEIINTNNVQPIIPRGEDYFLYAETTGPTDNNPFGTSTED